MTASEKTNCEIQSPSQPHSNGLELMLGAVGIGMGFVAGYACSWVLPIRPIENLAKKQLDTLSGHMRNLGLYAGFGFGAYSVVEDIVRDPTNPRSYIHAGVATLAAVADLAYRRGKSKHREVALPVIPTAS